MVFVINYHLLTNYISKSCSPKSNHGPPQISPDYLSVPGDPGETLDDCLSMGHDILKVVSPLRARWRCASQYHRF